jgi:hypothetical protein
MNSKLLKHIAYGWLVLQTMCIFILLEILISGKLYISLFLLIFAMTTYLNFKMFRKEKHER